jgi:hypothetical protein
MPAALPVRRGEIAPAALREDVEDHERDGDPPLAVQHPFVQLREAGAPVVTPGDEFAV